MTVTARSATITVALFMSTLMLGGCASARERELSLPVAADAAEPASAAGADVSAAGDSAADNQTDEPSTGAVFAGVRLRMRRDATLQSLVAQTAFVSEPACTSARLAPADGSRRAFSVERCVHAYAAGEAVQSTSLAGQNVRALVTYFVDGRLVRIDAQLESVDDAPALDRLGAELSERFGSASNLENDQGARWQAGSDTVDLYRSAAGSRLSVIDGAVLAVIPGLDADDPAAASE